MRTRNLVSSNCFIFDVKQFKNYFLLAFYYRDKKMGLQIAVVFFAASVLFFTLAWFLNNDIVSYYDDMSSYAENTIRGSGGYLFKFLLTLGLIALAGTIFGVRLHLGYHKPNWIHPRWQVRIEMVFRFLHASDTQCMLFIGLDEQGKPRRIVSTISPVTFLMPFAYTDTGPHDQPLFFDIVPGILPRYPKPTGDPIKPIQFRAEFYEDKIIKGSHGYVFVNDWSEILDVIEDKRYPNLAIIRKKETLEELVVKTDAFEGESWTQIKNRIAEATKEVSLKEELGKLKEELVKQKSSK